MVNTYIEWYGKGRHQNWRTPRSLFDQLHAEYGFTLDGASEPGNGLIYRASTADAPLSWSGHRVFCNPPWSNIRPFVGQAPAANCAVFLVPARTNAKWFHRALELGAEVKFFPGRPKFELPERTGPGHNSPVDCLLLIFQTVGDETTSLPQIDAPSATEVLNGRAARRAAANSPPRSRCR